MSDGTPDNVTRMADLKSDNRLITPVDLLRDAIADIEAGRRSPTKVLLLMLDDSEGGYVVNWYAAKMSVSQMVGLAEVAKQDIIRIRYNNA